jgi:hypothetical protein
MMPRELLDRAKEIACRPTGIPTDHMLISATHSHSAPAAMGALGCPADRDYAASLPEKIAAVIEKAAARLVPARVGWALIDDDKHTFCRRWIRRPDQMLDDPFGKKSVRANMHPGHVNLDVIAPSGPVDPGLTILAFQTLDGRPLAALANYSQHYYGAAPVSADYFGLFADALTRHLVVGHGTPEFVAIMSQGTSGDQMWMDYSRPREEIGLERYADEVAEVAARAYRSIVTFHEEPVVAMAETKLTLRRRVPNEERLQWARTLVAQMGERVPRNLPEVYAKEALFLQREPQRELKLQAIRIGELGITAIPNEVFALSGLKIKVQSPFPTTMNIALANGSEGYIPPPEQHALGGYTTWPARTAALEVSAEPTIVATTLHLLEQVAGCPRRDPSPKLAPYTEHVLASRPIAYWRLDEMEGARARDWTRHEHYASFEHGIAFFLPGLDLPGLSIAGQLNRAPHLAGGRLISNLDIPGESHSIEFWFWNGLPNDARPVTGYLLARATSKTSNEALGIGGTRLPRNSGNLFVTSRPGGKVVSGKTMIKPRTWHHVVLTRNGRLMEAYLDGISRPEIAVELEQGNERGRSTLIVGGQQEHESTLEGKIDEVAVYDRPLSHAEIREHFSAASAAR